MVGTEARIRGSQLLKGGPLKPNGRYLIRWAVHSGASENYDPPKDYLPKSRKHQLSPQPKPSRRESEKLYQLL